MLSDSFSDSELVAELESNMILLFAIENGRKTESAIPTFRNGFVMFDGFVIIGLLGALGDHNRIFDIIRLYITSYKCFDLKTKHENIKHYPY